MSKLIGRIQEINTLKEALENNKSELIAVYGRRRVGKTFLSDNSIAKTLFLSLQGCLMET
jgi:AAA+ ATPase superfamily predicted ATPase